MSLLRRRVSRRVIKSTFDESFEYDLPLPKNSILKRSMNIQPKSRLRRDVRAAPKILQQSRPPMKSKVKRSKTIAKLAVSRAAETLNKIEKNLMKPSRMRVNAALLSSTVKPATEKEIVTEKKDVKRKGGAGNNHKKIGKETYASQTSRSVKSESAFDSEEWQPVVNLEKLSVDARKRNIMNNGTRMPSTRLRSRTATSGRPTGRKASVSDDSLMLTSDSESEKESSSNISLDEELKGLDSTASTSSDDGDGNDTGFEELNKSKSSVLESPISQSSMNNPTNDSVLEDWPEDSSDCFDPTDKRFHDDNFHSPNNLKPGVRSDWSSSHVAQLFDLQEHFSCITNNLQSSLEDLKSVIEDKNVVIDAFKRKLSIYSGNEYHQMLDNILQNYDENDSESPSAQVIKLLRKFSVPKK